MVEFAHPQAGTQGVEWDIQPLYSHYIKGT